MTGRRSEGRRSGTVVDRAETGRLSRRFAENLALLRRRSGLSQATTAERAGLHTTEVSFLERGLRSPRLDTIVKLAGAIGVEPCELLAGMGWRLARNVTRPGAYVQQRSGQVAPADRAESP